MLLLEGDMSCTLRRVSENYEHAFLYLGVSQNYLWLSTFLQTEPTTGMAYRDEGLGNPMLLIHGLGSDHQVFSCNVPSLSKKFRCISIDLPGHGKSRRPKLPVTISFYAEQLMNFIRALDLQNLTLTGHSMGAQIILKLVYQFPEIADQIILLAPAGFETFTKWESQWLTSLTNPELIRNLTAEQVIQNIKANFHNLPETAQFMIKDRINLMHSPSDHDFYCQLIYQNTKAMLREPVFHLLGAISKRSMVLFGEDDQLIPNRILHPLETSESIGEKGCTLLRQSTLKMIAQAGHFLMLEKPALVNQEIVNFISQQR